MVVLSFIRLKNKILLKKKPLRFYCKGFFRKFLFLTETFCSRCTKYLFCHCLFFCPCLPPREILIVLPVVRQKQERDMHVPGNRIFGHHSIMRPFWALTAPSQPESAMRTGSVLPNSRPEVLQLSFPQAGHHWADCFLILGLRDSGGIPSQWPAACP